MSVASIRFATHARTWLLIAALTALLIGIGALLGGAFLYLFAGLAAAMNVIGYWFSDRFALKAGRTQPVAPGTMPELEAMVQDLTRRAQVPAPRLYTIPSEQPNPFATGATRSTRPSRSRKGCCSTCHRTRSRACSRTSSGTSRTARHPRLVDRRVGGRGDRGDRVALRRQPIGTAGCGDPLRDASADCRAHTPAAGARR
jgi:Zn-dependent protease with chaperone function